MWNQIRKPLAVQRTPIYAYIISLWIFFRPVLVCCCCCCRFVFFSFAFFKQFVRSCCKRRTFKDTDMTIILWMQLLPTDKILDLRSNIRPIRNSSNLLWNFCCCCCTQTRLQKIEHLDYVLPKLLRASRHKKMCTFFIQTVYNF